MLKIFKAINADKPKLPELDPVIVQRIKEGAFLERFIKEAQVAARKCEFYAGMATDSEVKEIFQDEVKLLRKSSRTFQQYYDSMTKE